MVSQFPRFILVCSLALLPLSSARARELSDYKAGDVVEADIVAPGALRAVNPEASEELKRKSDERTPVIFRLHSRAIDPVEEEFRAAFSLTRSNFVRAVERNFKQRKLEDAWLGSPVFEEVVQRFSRSNRGMPLFTNLATRWARGDEGRDERSALIGMLREAMRQPIRDQAAPSKIKLTAQVRIVSVTNLDEEITAESLTHHGKLIARTNAISLERARSELVEQFPEEERAMGKFLASLLRPNCFLDEQLTKQSRALKSESLWVVDNYAAGQVVARRGQKVDETILAALKVLREKLEADRLQAEAAASAALVVRTQERNRWLAVGLGISGVVVIVCAAMLLRRRRRSSLLPARIAKTGETAAVISCPTCDEAIVVPADAGGWAQRALEAEARADRAHAAIRSGVLGQLTQLLRERVFHGLVSQRQRMIETQQSAAVEIAEMQRRLDELHTPLKERLLAYEQRVSELEKALAAKGAENRELLKAKIQLVRQQAEREREQLNYN
ncbi:MAG: hypothetical protein EPO07_11170 [Verrucomicrobia bacterium]|nr:MAG: hypothetical protein EPO07_11170 [Verrucomicrobiota bacterium]